MISLTCDHSSLVSYDNTVFNYYKQNESTIFYWCILKIYILEKDSKFSKLKIDGSLSDMWRKTASRIFKTTINDEIGIIFTRKIICLLFYALTWTTLYMNLIKQAHFAQSVAGNVAHIEQFLVSKHQNWMASWIKRMKVVLTIFYSWKK